MERNEFILISFSLKDKQDVVASYKHDGKVVKEEFTEAVHPKLYAALMAFGAVAIKQTGLDPGKKTSKVEGVEARTINLFAGNEEPSLMITIIIEWKGGYKNSMNTVKMPLSVYREYSGIDVEPLVAELEDRAFALLIEGEVGHEQAKLL